MRYISGGKHLQSLVGNLPDDDESLAGLLHELAQSNIAAVRRAVACKSVLTEETVAILASDPSPEVIEALVNARRCSFSESALPRSFSVSVDEPRINRQIAEDVQRYYEQSRRRRNSETPGR